MACLNQAAITATRGGPSWTPPYPRSRKKAVGYTLAETAKAAVVTPSAVHRHFEGRDDPIAEAPGRGCGMERQRS